MTPVLTLQTSAGPFVFTGAEVPAHIVHGGTQAISVDRLIGGRKIARPMGPDEDSITFSGIFAYQGTARSDFLDSVRRRGEQCTLTWANRRMIVLVQHYAPDYIKNYQVGYTITLFVVRNESALVDSVPAVTPAQQLQVDSAHLNNLSACSGNATLSAGAAAIGSALTALQTAVQPIAKGLQPVTSLIGQAANCAAAVTNDIVTTAATIAAPIAQLLANSQALITNTENAISSAVSFGGVVPGNPLAQQVGGYMSQLNSVVQLPAIYEINSVAARMQSNLALTTNPVSSKTVTVGGGTLYDVAAQHYGDATQWTRIAAANNLTDPQLTGVNTLQIPA